MVARSVISARLCPKVSARGTLHHATPPLRRVVSLAERRARGTVRAAEPMPASYATGRGCGCKRVRLTRISERNACSPGSGSPAMDQRTALISALEHPRLPRLQICTSSPRSNKTACQQLLARKLRRRSVERPKRSMKPACDLAETPSEKRGSNRADTECEIPIRHDGRDPRFNHHHFQNRPDCRHPTRRRMIDLSCLAMATSCCFLPALPPLLECWPSMPSPLASRLLPHRQRFLPRPFRNRFRTPLLPIPSRCLMNGMPVAQMWSTIALHA